MRVGIDFGTTRTVVAVADRGNFPVVSFETEDGDVHDFFPSVAASDGERLVFGHEALVRLDREGWSGIRSFKRLLSRADAAARPNVDVGGVTLPLDQLLAAFLVALEDALLHRSTNPVQLAAGEPIEAFIAVPARASSAQRFLTIEAFRNAGFEVVGLMNEPSAASIEYAHRFGKTLTAARQQVLVYDMGGGTFDISLVDMAEGEHTVLDNSGVNDLGGDDFDHLLLDLAVAAAGPQQTDPTVLLDRCRLAKEGLNPNSRRITVDLDTESVSIVTNDFYEAAAPLIERSIETIADVLPAGDGERFDTSRLAGVYVVGGGSDLPAVSRQLKDVFGRRVRRSAYASGATAVGLAIAASQEGPRVMERFSRTFGVFRELDSGADVAFDAILTRDTPLRPDGGEWTRRYRPAHNIGHFRFAECDRIDGQTPTGDLKPFAELLFPFDPSLRDQDLKDVRVERAADMPLVEERYRVDDTGIVSVRITDLDSGWSREHTL
ncbi:MAG: Hsp70 family protein [Myxococcales bacterium]|nr:Hsp70 family protein [Myxococcales bacterium]